jgi:hypothetical protein
VQGLVDAAVMVITMVIPALLLEFGKKGLHSLLHSMQQRGCAAMNELYEEC